MSAISIVNATKRFGGLLAVNDVSFEVEDGKLTAIIGPNGAGKTTLFNLITNLYSLSSGDILYYGRSIKNMAPKRIAGLGLVRTFQTALVFPRMSVLENVLVGNHRHTRTSALQQAFWTPSAISEERELRRKAQAFLELTGLDRFASEAATDLPMGSQKLLEVTRALMARPRVLLLDEPAAGLNDTETADLASLLSAVRSSGVTVLLVEHNMSLVMGIADQVTVLDAGALVASGSPQQIQRDPRVIAAYVGQDEAVGS